MYSPLGSQWDAHIRNSGPRVVRASLYAAGATTSPIVADLPISDLSVTADRRAAHRRTGSLTIISEELLGDLKQDITSSAFSPYGNEIVIEAGVILSDGSEELVPLGVFQIDSLTWSDDGAEMRLELVDRSKIFQRRQFLFPYSPNGGVARSAIQDLLLDTLSTVSFSFSTDLDDVVLPGGVTYSGDYLEAIRSLASSMGADFFFDTSGVARVEPVPYISDSTTVAEAVWTIDSGSEGVLISTSESLSRTDTYNEVQVVGVSTGTGSDQPYALVQDLDPTSLTYILGGFGRSTLKVQRQELTDTAQCNVVAAATLSNSLGLSKTLSLDSIANPALEEGDIITVAHPDGRTELHLIDSITFDISGSSTISTRSREGS